MKRNWLWLALALLFCVGIILPGAWLSDEALVTLRSAKNLASGAGLTWNPGERLLVYGNPLWITLLAIGFGATRSTHYLPIVASGLLSLLALLILYRRVVRIPVMAALAILALGCSRAFTDYATSGMENALGHVFLALFLATYFKLTDDRAAPGGRPRITLLALIAAGGILTQYESAFIYLPALLHATRGRGMTWLGLSPVFFWFAFAIWYFGFPLPNAAYARMNAGLSAGQLTALGLGYLQQTDWVTLIAILGGLASTAFPAARRYAGLGWGLGLYLLFMIFSGATDAAGRLLTVPLFGAVALLAHTCKPTRPVVITALILLLGLRFIPGPASDRPWVAAIDERRLRPATRTQLEPTADVPIGDRIGALGLCAAHVIDIHGEADLLLARLPAAAFDPRLMLPLDAGGAWRTGRFLRIIPRGYMATLRSGRNQLSDPLLAQCYDDLMDVARGSLADPARWKTIWRLNRSREMEALDPQIYRDAVTIPIYDIESDRRHGTAMERARAGVRGADKQRIAYTLSFTGLRAGFPSTQRATRVRVGLEEEHDYLLAFYADGETIGCRPVTVGEVISGRIARTDVPVPPEAVARGFNAVGVFPVSGEGIALVGPLDLID